MDVFINLFSFLWLIRNVKFVLFWIYLWQLKEYHTGRFADHFRTYKGKQIFVSPLPILKVILIVALLANYSFFNIVFWALLLVYAVESAVFILGIKQKSIKRPAFTFKAVLLTLIAIALTLAYLFALQTYITSMFWLLFLLLAFDLLMPAIISLVVLAVQPFFVFARYRILDQARQKVLEHKNLTIIGITGSYGKTSSKEFLTTILSSKFSVLSTPEHKNSEMGIAQTILQSLTPDHKFFIVEMGAYNKGGIDLLCNMARPDIGIVTGVNEQHLSTFGSLENLLSAEGGRELARNLPAHGILIVNGDNAYCVDLYKNFKGNKRIYTSKENMVSADMWAEHIEVKPTYLDFILVSRQRNMAHCRVNVLGKHNIQNVLGAMMAAKELGMGIQEITRACETITQQQGGMVLKKGVHGITVIDSSYSANPDGVVADVDYLNVHANKKVIVMPCLIELGKESNRIHEELGKKIAQVCDLAIITTKDKFRQLETGFMSQGLNSRKMLFCDDAQEIFNVITTFCGQGDTVLLEGRVPGELLTLLYDR